MRDRILLQKLRDSMRHCAVHLNSCPRRTKTLIAAISAAVLIFMFWGLFPGTASAALDIANTLGSFVSIYIILYFIGSALAVLLGLAGAALDIAFYANINAVPSQLAVASEGWRLLRDLANGLLILVLVWIAITIIFNLEEYGGKRLLVRVIAVGLLLNFSLVFVTIPFALGNELARPFVRAIGVSEICEIKNGTKECKPPQQKLSDIIINNSRIQQTSRVISDKDGLQRLDADLKNLGSTPVPIRSQSGWLWQQLGSPPVAQATPLTVGAIAACGLLGIATAGWAIILCGVAASIVSAVATAAFFYLDPFGLASTALNYAVNLLISDLLMFLMTLTMFTAALLLYLRLFAMILIGVFAPLAFLALAMPRYGDRLWNPWLDNLFRWSFLAPIFYFLLYLALYMLQLNAPQSEAIKDLPPPANVPMMLNLILFLIFLWAAVYFSRRMAGQAGEIALAGIRRGLGYAGGYGLGLAQRHLLPRLGRVAEGAQERIARAPAPLQAVLRQPTAALRRVAKAGREQILRDSQEFDQMTSAEIQRTIGAGTLYDSQLASALMVLQRRRDLEPMRDSQGNTIKGYEEGVLRRGVDTIRGAGLDIVAFLRANPKLARARDFRTDEMDRVKNQKAWEEAAQKFGRTLTEDQFAQWLAWQRVRPQDFEAMDLGILGDENMREMFVLSAKAAHLGRLGQLRPDIARNINNYLTDPNEPERMKRILDQMDEGAINYFYTNAAGELGWRIPPGVLPSLGASTRLHNGTADEDYEADLMPSGGTPPYVYQIAETRPVTPDFNVDEEGRLRGHPAAPGDYRITVKMTDRGGAGRSTQRQFRVVIE